MVSKNYFAKICARVSYLLQVSCASRVPAKQNHMSIILGVLQALLCVICSIYSHRRVELTQCELCSEMPNCACSCECG